MTAKSQTTVYIDREKWNEISRRLPNMTLSFFIDHYLTNILNRMVENGIDLEDLYARATADTLTQLEEER